MSRYTASKPVFVAGAAGFVGEQIVRALLAAGASVTAMVAPDATMALDTVDPRLRIIEGDAWNLGSLNGRSRGHRAVIHAVGSLHEQPNRGLSYHYLNTDSLQNIARMAISDGVQHLVYLSASGAPWLPRSYVASKREAERYLMRSGIPWTVVRSPLAFAPGQLHNPLLLGFRAVGSLPLLGWPFSRWAPLPVMTLAQGIAVAASAPAENRILYARQMRRLAREFAPVVPPQIVGSMPLPHEADTQPVRPTAGPLSQEAIAERARAARRRDESSRSSDPFA